MHAKKKPAKKLPQQVNIHEAKTHFSALLQRVANGEEITVAHAGEPVAKLVPYHPTPPRREWTPDPRLKELADLDWFSPDPEIEKLFYGDHDDILLDPQK